MRFLAIAVYFSAVLCSTAEHLAKADALYSQEGPTLLVLQSYDYVLQQPDADDKTKTLVYFKKALISINLSRTPQAIADLHLLLELDPNHKAAISKLSQLYLERGQIHDILPEDIKNTLVGVNQLITNAYDLYHDKNYLQVIETLQPVLEISPLNYEALTLQKDSSFQLYKQDLNTKIDDVTIHKVLIKNLNKLISINRNQLQNYDLLSNLLLFTELDFKNSRKINQNCLKIDNDYKPCRDLAKFQSKLSVLLENLENYSILLGHYNIKTETPSLPQGFDFDFKLINTILFKDELKVNKIDLKSLPKSIKTNYDYLIYKSSEFSGKFVDDLTKLGCESYIQINDFSGGQTICKKVQGEFLPKEIPTIDKLIANKQFDRAKQSLSQYSANIQLSELFQSRWRKVDEYFLERHREQQRQQQQQQQQQHRQYQQRRQQQHQQQQQRAPPKTDYYKLLDVGKDADEKTIKKGYRTQTLKYHPDKCGGTNLTADECEAKMQDINSAYEVLSNPDLKARYDRGDDPNDHAQQHAQQQNPFGQFNFQFGGGQFEQFFQNGFDFGDGRAKAKRNRRRN